MVLLIPNAMLQERRQRRYSRITWNANGRWIGTAHFYTWSAAMYRALCEATARTSENPGRLRCSAPNKGLRPLRRFAAIPAPPPEGYTPHLRLRGE